MLSFNIQWQQHKTTTTTTTTTIAIAWMLWLLRLLNGNGNGNSTDGGGTLDQAQTSSATYIRSYAKTFSKFIAIYNHLSHFHNPALACDRYHTYVSCLPIQSILLVQVLVTYYDFKWLLSHLNHLYTGGGSIRHATISFTFCMCIKFLPGIVKLIHMA